MIRRRMQIPAQIAVELKQSVSRVKGKGDSEGERDPFRTGMK